MNPRLSYVFVTVLFTVVAWSRGARAQSQRFADEPTNGMTVPTTGIAGDGDALSTIRNPAGLQFVPGSELAVAGHFEDDDETSGQAEGLGLFYATGLGGSGLLPRVGLGAGIEVLRPARSRLTPDPGTPTRVTLASSLPLGNNAALGMSWHRYIDGGDQVLSGVSSWNAGVSFRLGAHLAGAAVVRDLFAPVLTDEMGARVPVQRRYEAEFVGRPWGDDRLELALGGRIGEVRGDVDGWARGSLRLLRGIHFKTELVSESLQAIDTTMAGLESEKREWRLTAGLSWSFGATSVTTLATGVSNSDGRRGFRSGSFIARARSHGQASILPARKRLEVVELKGAFSQLSHTKMVSRLRQLQRDDAVVGVVLKFDGYSNGWASTRELRNEVLNLRAAGKKVVAYLLTGTAREYLIASAANKVFVDPAGGIRLAGLAGTLVYYRGFFDFLGVNAQFEKIAEYKSAPEAYTERGPTKAAARVRERIFDSLSATMMGDISRTRGISQARVRKAIDSGPYVAGDFAGETALVDKVVTPQEIDKEIALVMGGAYPIGTRAPTRPARWRHPEVAVVHLEGDIVGGKSRKVPLLGRRLVGSATIVQSLLGALADPQIKAVVLRIDSPGGSAVASELMSRSVFRYRGRKPIICSFGDLAASGGYFAAAGCDTIFADPMTITGSIGIFYGKFDLSGLLTRLGISWKTFSRGRRADMESSYRPYTAEERTFLQGRLRYLYDRFVTTVAKGRKMSKTRVDAVARGRVWTGQDAKAVGLVDRFGGVGDAIVEAKRRAGLNDDTRVRLRLLPREPAGLLGRLLAGNIPGVAGDATATFDVQMRRLLDAALGGLPGAVVAEPQQAQASLPFSIRWSE